MTGDAHPALLSVPVQDPQSGAGLGGDGVNGQELRPVEQGAGHSPQVGAGQVQECFDLSFYR